MEKCFPDYFSGTGSLAKCVPDILIDMQSFQVIQARNNIHSLLETVQEQQQQFIDVAQLCNADSGIPVAFTKDNRVHIGPKMEMRAVALGLDGAGKTSILFKLKQDEFVSPITTIGKLGFNELYYSASTPTKDT